MVQEKLVASDNANTTQVGGDHYKTEYEHWDFVEAHGLGYLEAAATKYVTRWRTKNGVQDLQKALHYIDKLMELYSQGRRLPRGVAPINEARRFCGINNLDPTESAVIHYLSSWADREHLLRARDMVRLLIQEAGNATD